MREARRKHVLAVCRVSELMPSQNEGLFIPYWDGSQSSQFELASILKHDSFDLTTPLVFHSASACAEDIQRRLDAGAQAYITKPSNPDNVIEVIRTLIAETAAD